MSDILITFGFIVLIGVLMIVGAIIKSFFEERRTKACKKAVDELGLDFQAVDQDTFDREASGFQLTNIGHSHKHRNFISAVTDDVTIRLFDYKYATGSGRSESTYSQTVALIRPANFEIPPFHAKPEKFIEELCGLLGYQDIDFDDHPAFSKTFMLQPDREAETRQFFCQPLLDFLALRPKISFESKDNSFLFYESKHSVKPKNLGEMLEEAYRVFRLLRECSEAVDTPMPVAAEAMLV